MVGVAVVSPLYGAILGGVIDKLSPGVAADLQRSHQVETAIHKLLRREVSFEVSEEPIDPKMILVDEENRFVEYLEGAKHVQQAH